jgi:FkbM family methyltransferase
LVEALRMLKIHRRDLIVAAAAGASGGAAGFLGHRRFRTFPRGATPSYSQSGEDVIVNMIFGFLGVKQPSYLDIGAWLPQAGNNTYLSYTRGGRGVLVEPNVAMIPELKAARPGDTVLNVGIGVTGQKEADYYCMTVDQWNTFDKEEAELRAAKSQARIVKVVKMPLVTINKVIEEHFRGKAPDFISIDVEGLDVAIMQTLDFQRFRPKVICAETLVPLGFNMDPAMTKFLAQQGYEARAVTFPNTIYVDKSLRT